MARPKQDRSGAKQAATRTGRTPKAEVKTPIAASSDGTSGGGRSVSDFPKYSLRDAIQIADAVEAKNGGQPIPPNDLAIAIDKSPGSSVFRVLLSASIKYGLTSGSFNQPRVKLEPLGTRLVAPESHEDKRLAAIEAVLKPPTFHAIFNYFKGKKLPETQFFQNTVVREFGTPRDHAEQCVKIFLDNVEYAGLVREATTGRWLSSEAAPSTVTNEDDIGEADAVAEERSAERLDHPSVPVPSSETPKPVVPAASNPPAATINHRVFVTHGKNHSLVPQLKELLNFGGFEPIVSVERESVSKPVPDKVMDDMRMCGAAILHVDAERELISPEGEKEVVLNANVLIEIGGAMALYGRRFILLVEKGVRLPSNLLGLYEVRYEGEKLDGDATLRLLKAFNEFKTNPPPPRG
jgi:predicted nucleotide-binding protein